MTEFNDRVVAQFRRSGGVVGGWGGNLVLIRHRGARSGITRINPAMSIRDGESWMVLGSALGAPRDPGWVFNLRAHPDATIEVAGARGVRVVPVTAEELTGRERDTAFARFVRMAPSFGEYQAKAGRLLPVIRLRARSTST